MEVIMAVNIDGNIPASLTDANKKVDSENRRSGKIEKKEPDGSPDYVLSLSDDSDRKAATARETGAGTKIEDSNVLDENEAKQLSEIVAQALAGRTQGIVNQSGSSTVELFGI